MAKNIKKRVGAPKKKAADVKSERIPVRLTKSKKRAIETAAKRAGLTASAYLVALHDRVGGLV